MGYIWLYGVFQVFGPSLRETNTQWTTYLFTWIQWEHPALNQSRKRNIRTKRNKTCVQDVISLDIHKIICICIYIYIYLRIICIYTHADYIHIYNMAEYKNQPNSGNMLPHIHRYILCLGQVTWNSWKKNKIANKTHSNNIK